MTKFKFGDMVWHDEFGVCIYHHSLGYKNMCRVITERDGSKKVSENNITKVSDWIQCSERMPKHGDMVLVFNGNSIEIDALATGEFDFECWCDSVTHWMPLPAPPTEVER